MDASASSKIDAVKDVYAFFLKIENNNFPTPSKQKSTVIKYTKLPEFEYGTKGACPKHSYTLQPRLRRIITLEEPKNNSSRSLKTMELFSQSSTTANINNRKIVTINEDDEYDLHPKSSNHHKKSSTVITNRAVETEARKDTVKQISQRNMPRLTKSAKYSKDTKCAAKMNTVCDSSETASRSMYKNKLSNQSSLDTMRSRAVTEKDTTRKTKSASLPRTSLSKHYIKPSESEQEMSLIKEKLNASLNSTPSKRNVKNTHGISLPSTAKGKAFLIEMQKKRKLTPVIHVPLEEKCHKRKFIATSIPTHVEKPTIMVYTKSDGTMDTEIVLHHDVNTCTEPPPETVDAVTNTENYEPGITYKYIERTDLQAGLIKETFDNLDIPNVSLKKDKIEFNEKLFDLHSKSLPSLQIPPLNVKDNRKEKSILDTHYCKSTSYIISRSTLTYETQQKINFHVVDNNDKAYSNQLPSQLKYPMSVVSVFKEEMSSKDRGKCTTLEDTLENKSSKKYKNCVNEIKSLNCSYVPNSNKLMKPSDIISTIRVNNGLLQSVFVCEQFQRELNFIDSFFESLQYLESCSLSEKCYKDDKIEQLVNDSAILDRGLDPKNSEYDKFFSKLENGANSDDSETMASKNLFLLNILIRDEQRRAKNLLCVLKRREDALKDFTKSQILYLENKKRQDNTDISALKKKQRGALLKLQHECGEMQRMRKALLALSEKRKVALMKTKKDLELKLKNNVNVDQIILGKKKLKRNTFVDRTSLPLKCFDLSSSGCEESTTSRNTSESVATEPASVVQPVNSAEKSIQTTDNIMGANLMERSTNTTDENFVVVDGGYLNILFHNLTLPQIFSARKQYEVNEEALKNIIDSTNTRQGEDWSDVVEKLITQQKNEEEDKTSTPSTARSLVEEFEQYYRTLAEEDRSPDTVSGSRSPTKVYETSDATVQTSLCKMKARVSKKAECVETMTTEPVKCVKVTVESSSEYELVAEEEVRPQALAGPLSVLVGSLLEPAGSLDVPAEPLLELAESLPVTAGPLLEPAGSLLEPAGSLAVQAGFLPVPAEAPLEPAEATPELAGSLLEPAESLPVPTESLPVPTGPLPVPPGAARHHEPAPLDDIVCPTPKSSATSCTGSSASSQPPCEAPTPPSPTPSLEPAQSEAEELRRQQLAIEREIKELELQQCRLLVVREIPDKPPPPYTPPVEVRPPKKPRPFRADDVTQQRIRKYVINPATATYVPEDAFDLLIHDFSKETVAKYKSEHSDKPWDASNLLPQRPAIDSEKLIDTATSDLTDVLTAATPSSISGVSSRRSDHIDDILFAEWRRAEPEWTSLHNDEALVKNQLFETIFQRILTDTVDEYKRTVLEPTPDKSLVL